jgi:hypothetical protein
VYNGHESSASDTTTISIPSSIPTPDSIVCTFKISLIQGTGCSKCSPQSRNTSTGTSHHGYVHSTCRRYPANYRHRRKKFNNSKTIFKKLKKVAPLIVYSDLYLSKTMSSPSKRFPPSQNPYQLGT